MALNFHTNACIKSLYVTSLVLIVVAPLLVLASNYILLGRLILFVLPNESKRILGLPPTHITKIFLTIDVLSFFVQAAGSGVAPSDDWQGKKKDVGTDMLIASLATQLATNLVFLILLWVFSQRAYFGPHKQEDAPEKWERAFEACVISTTLIMVRPLAI
jgi:hypothetical protein